ncbi:MAG: hypothetical protein IRZ11_08220 [Clostridia bacterium]|nr:hypothetical protein [Clostridia bacterium]
MTRIGVRACAFALAVAFALVAAFLPLAPKALAWGLLGGSSGTSSCYVPSGDVVLDVELGLLSLSGLRAVDEATGATASLTFDAQEGVWWLADGTTGACAPHSYVVVSLFGVPVGYIDPPFCATVWK